jgi:hypothetical protein
MPDRDVLWVAVDEGQDLAPLQRKATTMAAAASHPVSGRIYRMTQAGPQPALAD